MLLNSEEIINEIRKHNPELVNYAVECVAHRVTLAENERLRDLLDENDISYGQESVDSKHKH